MRWFEHLFVAFVLGLCLLLKVDEGVQIREVKLSRTECPYVLYSREW
jgi:hypothetical protein